MQPWLDDFMLEDEIMMPTTFIPEPDKRAVELHLHSCLQSELSRPIVPPRLPPISELLDLATFEAGVLQACTPCPPRLLGFPSVMS